jgi:L-ascorbate metabolism protein UlaG (beta-lactamase superfamily)
MIQNKNITLYFAGDTAFDKIQTATIKKHFNKIDLALVPIAPCDCNHTHVDPKEALYIIDILAPKSFIPIHWGTFAFDYKGAQKVISELKKEWYKKKRPTQLHILGFGQPLKIN